MHLLASSRDSILIVYSCLFGFLSYYFMWGHDPRSMMLRALLLDWLYLAVVYSWWYISRFFINPYI